MSTARQAREGDSLESQEIVARGVASRNQWNVVKVFNEPYSGRKDERPLVEEIVAYIRDPNNKIDHYLIKGIDRFTRAGYIEYQRLKDRIEALGVHVVDSYGLIQPKQNTLAHLGVSYDWSEYSPSETAEMLEAHRGKLEVRDILSRMIGAQIQLQRDGYKVARPADGYLNKRIEVEGKKRHIEVPDPKRAKFFREMFRLRAAGTLPDREIVRRVNRMGYLSKPTKRWSRDKSRVLGWTKAKPLTTKRMQSIIKKPIYCGVIVTKWTDGKPVRARYDGLVSIETFNRANRGDVTIEQRTDGTLGLTYGSGQRLKRLAANPTYPYKNVVMCPTCRSKPFLGSASRGKSGKTYPAYHCNRGHYLRVPKDEFEATVDGFLRSLEPKPGYLQALGEGLRRALATERERLAELEQHAQNALRELQAEQDQVVEAIVSATSPTVRQKLEARVEEIETRLQEVRPAGPEELLEDASIDQFLEVLKETMEHLPQHLKDPCGTEAQRELWDHVFEDWPTYDELLNGTPKLRPAFGLNRDFRDPESLYVHVARLGWNTWAHAIRDLLE